MKKQLAPLWGRYYLLTGILMFLSFPSYDVAVLKLFPLVAWFAPIPLMVYVRDRKPGDVFLAAFAAGIVGNLLTFGWIGHFGAKVPGGFLVILIFLIPVLSVFFTLRIFLAELLARRFEKLRFLIYPAVWIMVDTIHTLGFLAFPWMNWGYSQYPFTAFVQTASVVGITGINFIMITGAYLVADFIHLRAWRNFSGAGSVMRTPSARRLTVFIVLLALVITWGYVRIPGRPSRGKGGRDADRLRVTMIQSCISPWENWDIRCFEYLKELETLTAESMRAMPDFIIWSESATLEYISYRYEKAAFNTFTSEVLAFVQTCGRPLLTGEIGIQEVQRGFEIERYPQNNAVLIAEDGRVMDTYPKINLVPFGEWFPYEKWFPHVKKVISGMGGSDFVPGDRPVVFETSGHRFGTLICYEGIFYRLCRRYKQLGADFLVNITNDGWTDTYSGHMQHFSASVFRAVENGLWVVRAGNTGYTAAIDPYGRIRSSIPILKPGWCVADLDFSLNRDTVYFHLGDLLVWADLLFLLALCVILLAGRIRVTGPKGG